MATNRRRWRRIAEILCIAIALSAPVSTSASDGSWLQLLNDERRAAAMPELEWDESLAGLAQSAAAVMATTGTLAHTEKLGTHLTSVLPTWNAAGENIAEGNAPGEIHESFMSSPPHRANILGPFSLVGVGVVTDADGTLWVAEIFAATRARGARVTPRPRPTSVAAVPTAAPPVPSATATPAPTITPVDPQPKAIVQAVGSPGTELEFAL